MYCTECGAALKNGVKYCTSCGTKVEDESSMASESVLSTPDSSSAMTDITYDKHSNIGQRILLPRIAVMALLFAVGSSIIVGIIGIRNINRAQNNTHIIMDIASADVGDYITFGHYEQDNNSENGEEPIEWQVLEKKDGRTLLISRFALDCQQYNTTLAEITWEKCSLRGWLNSSFYRKAFDETERKIIEEVEINNPDSYACFESDRSHVQILGASYGDGSFVPIERPGASGGNITFDRVFLLNYEEVWHYFDSDEVIQCTPTSYAIAQGTCTNIVTDKCYWWLRSPGSSQREVLYASYSGELDEKQVYYGNCAVRPALWITTKKETEYSEREKAEQIIQQVEDISDNQGKTIEDTEERAAVKGRLIEERERAIIANSSVGEYVNFGHYEQNNNIEDGMEPIEWQVLAKEDGKTLVISRYCLDVQPYNVDYVDVTWDDCTLRGWLNNDFFTAAFDIAEQDRIDEVVNGNLDSYMFYNSDYENHYFGNTGWGANGGKATYDRVFLLSYEEALDYFDSDAERKCIATAYAKTKDRETRFYDECCWWLRSPGNYQNTAMYVDYYEGKLNIDHISARGIMDGGGEVSMGFAVRPSIWIID